jgi:ATP-dependent DNA ligase
MDNTVQSWRYLITLSALVSTKNFVDIMWQRAVKKSGLEGLVVKRKDGKYAQQAVWYKILNPTYTQKAGRQDF